MRRTLDSQEGAKSVESDAKIRNVPTSQEGAEWSGWRQEPRELQVIRRS